MMISINVGAPNGSADVIQAKVDEQKSKVNEQILSRGTRSVNELRNAALDVLSGRGGGRVYKKPGGGTYQASAPGNPPARRTGNLRLNWTGKVTGGGGDITIKYESNAEYAGYLENGTRRMAARPFKDKITEKAMPKITKIFSEPYV